MQKQIFEKMKFNVLIGVFVITIFVSQLFKPSINYVDAQTLAKDITGVGKIKSEKIIAEREAYGFFKGEKDFYERTKKLGIGEVSFNRIKKAYKLK